MLACPEKFEAFEIKRDFSRVSPVDQTMNLAESKLNRVLARKLLLVIAQRRKIIKMMSCLIETQNSD